MSPDRLNEVVDAHRKWLSHGGGKRAELRNVDLRGAELRGANLSHADLSNANLSGAELSHAELRGANLRNANLSGAELSHAELSHADLSNADLSNAELSGADLSAADLSGADLRGAGLWSVTGNMRESVSLQCDTWPVVVWRHDSGAVMQIGCQRHDVTAWLRFDDDAISKMDSDALQWWRVWKPVIVSVLQAKQWVSEDAA